ncbi:MAG: TIGR02281 family clan AA aspartic protease [Pseudomonadota bacterium]
MFWFALIAIIATLIFLFVSGGETDLAGLDGDGIAALVSLVLIGTLVASGFIASRQSAGSMAKQAIAWIAIVLALMVGYEYRFELQNVASRVTAGAIPGVAITARDSEGNQVVELRRAGNSFVTNAEINGEPGRFIVDTGATTVVLTSRTARDIGINIDNLSFTIPVGTANGVAQAASVRLETLAIGGIERRNIQALVAQDGALFENLLGMNFLNTLSGYDVRADRMVLRN